MARRPPLADATDDTGLDITLAIVHLCRCAHLKDCNHDQLQACEIADVKECTREESSAHRPERGGSARRHLPSISPLPLVLKPRSLILTRRKALSSGPTGAKPKRRMSNSRPSAAFPTVSARPKNRALSLPSSTHHPPQ